MPKARTDMQANADEADLYAFRLLSRLENMRMSADSPTRIILSAAIEHIKSARADIRSLMHVDDRKVTSGA